MIDWIPSVILVLVSLHSIHHVSALPDWITQDMIDMVNDDKLRCMQEHGTAQEILDKANEGVIPNDPAFSCYLVCLFESFGVIDDETGDFDAEMLLGFFPDDIQAKGRPVLMACGGETGSDKCNKMYNIATCLYSKNPALWFVL